MLLSLAAPMLAFGLRTVLDGNGFVAAFVCGIATAPAAAHAFRRSQPRMAS